MPLVAPSPRTPKPPTRAGTRTHVLILAQTHECSSPATDALDRALPNATAGSALIITVLAFQPTVRIGSRVPPSEAGVSAVVVQQNGVFAVAVAREAAASTVIKASLTPVVTVAAPFTIPKLANLALLLDHRNAQRGWPVCNCTLANKGRRTESCWQGRRCCCGERQSVRAWAAF